MEYFEGLVASTLKRIPARTGLLLAGFTVLFAGLFISRITTQVTGYVLYGILFLAVILAVVFAVPAWQTLQYRRTSNAAASVAWVFTRDHIRIRAAGGETQVGWKTFQKPAESRNVFFLYSTSNNRLVYIFPKRAFLSPVQMDRFRELLKKTYGKMN